ncbi:hypothetical protein [Deinococcus misasensis]|uniref:hypothetical protein n=1 Tax=Deinococcus misasensis TaxID=392413 RepID=UPI00054E3C99|nr:hypothetical protein [Deinococcus misasensis]
MKKLALFAALLFGGSAFAGSVDVKFNAAVENVCVINSGGSDTDIIEAKFDKVVSLSYDASRGLADDSAITVYSVKCTAGTVFSGGAKTSGSVDLKVGSEGLTVLTLNYTDDLQFTADAGDNSGDVYQLTLTPSIDTGKWSVPAGTYTGTLIYTISYE